MRDELVFCTFRSVWALAGKIGVVEEPQSRAISRQIWWFESQIQPSETFARLWAEGQPGLSQLLIG
jgi:hypothetical protein